ncbi:MAG: hypothetical protein GX663_09735 [Clostridiales bacterium]|nr:hypothetical protein [Clostridiales bacterium]
MKIEVLFPEVCNLYGELGNIRFLKWSYPEIQVVETALTEEPLFLTEEPDLIYMGTMTENSQPIVIEKLRQYKNRICQLIDEGGRFLITGNALEVFGKTIEDKDGTVVQCLGIFDTVARRDMMSRFNSLYIGEFEGMTIVGYKSQFTHSYWDSEESRKEPLFNTVRGPGINPDEKGEGIRVNNFMATYIIGPLTILSPPFAKWMLRECGGEDILAHEEEAMDAYNTRIEEYSDPNTGFYYE